MITCIACGFDNANDLEFCECCGAELEKNTAESVDSSPVSGKTSESIAEEDQDIIITGNPSSPATLEEEPVTAPTTTSSIPNIPQPSIAASTARLIAKQSNAPVPEFTIEEAALIGIFDPDMGPVDIDLEEFVGNETVSRHHAEINLENGIWKIKDLGSTNGVFIKPVGQTRFGARITTPESLNPGDEIAIAKIRFLFQSP